MVRTGHFSINRMVDGIEVNSGEQVHIHDRIRTQGMASMATVYPPRHIVWSTDRVDLSDPFQRMWYLRQVLMHGRSEDIRTLDLEQVEKDLDQLDLPPDLYEFWKMFLESRHDSGQRPADPHSKGFSGSIRQHP
jgi:hypothetical protein